MKNRLFKKKTVILIVLCLLWSPSYCDSRHNEKSNSQFQQNIAATDVPNEPKIISTSEEEKTLHSEKVVLDSSKEITENVHKSKEERENKMEAKNKHVNSEEILVSAFSEKVTGIHAIPESPAKSLNLKNITDSDVTEDVHTEGKLLKQSVILNKQAIPVVASSSEDGTTLRSQIPGTSVKDGSADSTRSVVDSPVDNVVVSADGSQHSHSEAMPSFDEWKKMMLAEQEKDGHKIPSPGPPGKKLTSQKRRRNYASYECGAKIVASNSEAESTSRILNELVDEYMLNPCKAKIWFVIELCETVQATQIELANFELFSSCPKDFAVYSSDNFPTRDWIPLGTFTAAEQRVLQSFALKQEGFGKFIKIELLSYYGKEHYCPLSVVRIFGTSMVDEYEEMETLAAHHQSSDDDLDRLDIPVEDNSSTNLFGSATDAVFNIVKKAAQVLGQHQSVDDSTGKILDLQNVSEEEHCKLPGSSDTCLEINKENQSRITGSLTSEFLLSSSSLHHSLFQHLRHCNQCISDVHAKYHSIAPPQCRFFQAALGPVVFETICSWFRDHQLVIAEEKPKFHDKDVKSTSKLLSPPPTVISVIIDNIPVSRSLPVYSDSATSIFSESEKVHSVFPQVNLESIVKDSLSPGITVIESSIQPTKTVQTSESDNEVNIYNKKTESPEANIAKQKISTGIDVSSVKYDRITATIVEESSVDLSLMPSILTQPVEETLTTAVEISSQIIKEESDLSKQDASSIPSVEIGNVVNVTEESTLLTSEEYSDEVRIGDEKASDFQKEASGKMDTSFASGVASSAGQKESVFVRMNNRIKALELNMSLSSQYLQELSQRYRRQMEEMQRAFNRTIGTLNDTAKKAAEKDQKQQELIGNLQSQVANLSQAVDLLLEERLSASRQIFETHMFVIVVQIIILVTFMSLYVRRISFMLSTHISPLQATDHSPVVPKKRSSDGSSDIPSSPSSSKILKRSASEEALATGESLLIVEPVVPTFVEPPPKTKKKHKKKNKSIHRSASNPSILQRTDSTASVNSKVQTKSDETSAAGVLFNSLANAKSKCTQLEKHPHDQKHSCENCNKSSSSSECSLEISRGLYKGSRPHSAPLKNLTNGGTANLCLPTLTKNSGASKEKFNLKKFLRLQKRDSI